MIYKNRSILLSTNLGDFFVPKNIAFFSDILYIKEEKEYLKNIRSESYMEKLQNIKDLFVEFWNEVEIAYLCLFKDQSTTAAGRGGYILILIVAVLLLAICAWTAYHILFFAYNAFCVLFIDKHVKDNAFNENDITKELKKRKALDKAIKRKGYNAETVGKMAEEDCVKVLKNVFPDMMILQNVYPYFKESEEKMSVAECDIIGITDKNIYVFEVKNYSGVVYPTNDTYWLNASYADINPQGQGSYKFSPVRQNHMHIEVLSRILAKEFPGIKKSIQSIVVFADRTMLVMPDHAKDRIIGDAKVCNLDKLIDIVKNTENVSDSTIDKSKISNFLMPYLNVPENIKETSLRRAKSHFGR